MQAEGYAKSSGPPYFYHGRRYFYHWPPMVLGRSGEYGSAQGYPCRADFPKLGAMTSLFRMKAGTIWIAWWTLSVSLAMVASPRPAEAQNRWFPDEVYFTRPQAAPREPAFALRLLWTDLFRVRGAPRERAPFLIDEPAEQLEREAQGEFVLGGNVRLWQAASWEGGGLTVGLASAVFGRFRLETGSQDLVSTDWVVALPFEARRGAWSGRFQIMHWSAHLGDELIQQSGADRVDFTHNGLSLLVARDLGDVRVYGGASRLSRATLEGDEPFPSDFTDRATVQFGADALWSPWASVVLLEAGIDYQASDRTDWAGQWSAIAGIGVQDGDRSVQLRGRFVDGPSMLGQFFLTDERAWGFELVIALSPSGVR